MKIESMYKIFSAYVTEEPRLTSRQTASSPTQNNSLRDTVFISDEARAKLAALQAESRTEESITSSEDESASGPESAGSGGGGGGGDTSEQIERIKQQMQQISAQLQTIVRSGASPEMIASQTRPLEQQLAALKAQLAELLSNAS